MLSFRHTLVPGGVAVRAYITEACQDKRLAHLSALVRAMLEQQPAPRQQVTRRAAHQRPQALQRVGAGGECRARLAGERGECRIVRRDVGRIADQQIEARAKASGSC